MLKNLRSLILTLLFIILANIGAAAHEISHTDTLLTLLESKADDLVKQKQLTKLFYNRFLLSSCYDNQIKHIGNALNQHSISGKQELIRVAHIYILRRLNNLPAAEKELIDAIGVAQGEKEKYLLYYFYNNLAYVQTDQNNVVGAIHNYRRARKEAHELGDPELIFSTDIGISDLFTTIGLYQQGLIYLNRSQQQVVDPANNGSPSRATIYINKAEIFFRIAKLDSLIHYRTLYSRYGRKSYDVVRNLKRLDYYRLILSGQPQKAIVLIRSLLKTGNLYYKNVDRWYLAQSLYAVNNPDTALIEAQQILRDDKYGPSPLRLNAFKLIANIAEDKNQHEQAERYFKLALAESEGFTVKMRSIDLLSTELRQDRLDAAYEAQYLIYHKERTFLFASIAVTILIILVIYLFYRNVKQKSTYQKLLHETRSRELAFINSHEVRKPLANILAICALLKEKGNTEEETNSYYEILDQQVKEMDKKLKEVELKLREHN